MLSGKRYSSWMQMLGIENVADLILRTETTKCLSPLLPNSHGCGYPGRNRLVLAVTLVLVLMPGNNFACVFGGLRPRAVGVKVNICSGTNCEKDSALVRAPVAKQFRQC